MTGYFVRRFLLIIPTFIGITMAVFLVMNFVPGGPVERQIMQYKMSLAQRGGGRSADVDIPQEAIDEMRSATTALTSRCTSGMHSGCGKLCTWIWGGPTFIRIPYGTSSSPGFPFQFSWV